MKFTTRKRGTQSRSRIIISYGNWKMETEGKFTSWTYCLITIAVLLFGISSVIKAIAPAGLL